MSCQNVLEKCRDISATKTRRDIFWRKNEISTYRRFQLSARTHKNTKTLLNFSTYLFPQWLTLKYHIII